MRKSIFKIQKEEDYLKYKDEIDINEIDDVFSGNALHEASYKKSKWLIANGADMNHKDCFGHTALFKSDYRKTLLLIKNGADINLLDGNGNNALFYAEEPKKIKLLLENNININQVNKEGNNALFYNSINVRSVEYLIEAGIDINHKNNEGCNVLFYATEHTSLILLKSGIDVNNINKDGENVLFYANYAKTLYLIDKLDEPTFSLLTPETMDVIKDSDEDALTPEKETLILKRKAEFEKNKILEEIQNSTNKDVKNFKRL